MTTVQGPAGASVPAPPAPLPSTPPTGAATGSPNAEPPPAPANPSSEVLAKLQAIRNANYPQQAVTEIERNDADLARAKLSFAKQQLGALRDLFLKSGALLDPQTAAQFARFAAGYARDIADATKSFSGSAPDPHDAEAFGTDARDGLVQASMIAGDGEVIASFGDRDARRDARNSRDSVRAAIAKFNSAVARL